jgi:cytochrome c553
MKKTLFMTAILVFFSANVGMAASLDELAGIKPGMEKVTFCERCHGVKGFTDNNNMPKLAGQNKGYLIRQLVNFRKGIRKSAPMRQVTLTLSDEDIENLATYFSNVEVAIKD